MKRISALFVLAVSVFAVACGSSDKSEVTPENLAASMDEVCNGYDSKFEAMGVRGQTNPQLVLEFESSTATRQEILDDLRDLNLNEEAKAEIDPYFAATEKIIATDQEIIAAASEDDTEAVTKAFEEQTKAFTDRDKIAEKIGTEVCGQVAKTEVVPTGTTPPEDLSYAEPKNTIEEAADTYIETLKDGNCKKVNANRHSDAGELDQETCKAVSSGFADATVAGTESYGPVGQAEIQAGGTNYPTFFVIDQGQTLKYGGDAVHDGGGLRPAPEDNNSDEQVDAALAAIRDNDGEAFNSTLPDESSGFWIKDGGEFETFSEGGYNAAFVTDVRDSDAEPVRLGINSTFGFYYLEGNKNDWVLTSIHTPGLGGKYGFSGYWPVPKP